MEAASLLPTSSADTKLLTATLEPSEYREDVVLGDTLLLLGRGGGCSLDCNRSMPGLAHALERYQGQKPGDTEAV